METYKRPIIRNFNLVINWVKLKYFKTHFAYSIQNKKYSAQHSITPHR